jgi:hypothetical protein
MWASKKNITCLLLQLCSLQSFYYTTCLVHTLKSLNRMSKSEIKYSKKKILFLYEEIQWPLNFFIQNSNLFFGIFKFWLRHMIYMHLLTWVGFGLLGYVPNTLYKTNFFLFSKPSQSLGNTILWRCRQQFFVFYIRLWRPKD